MSISWPSDRIFWGLIFSENAGTPISCGSNPDPGNPSAGGFCGMTEAMLNSEFGQNITLANAKLVAASSRSAARIKENQVLRN